MQLYSFQNSKNDDSFPPGKSQNESRKDFLNSLFRTEQEADSQTAIRAYKQLLKINARVEQKYIEEILLNLCRLLAKNRLYGEELYCRLTCRYYFDSMLSVPDALIREDKINQAYRNVMLALRKNPGKLKIIIISPELAVCNNLIEMVRSTGNRQSYIFPVLERIASSNARFLSDIDLIICFDQNPAKLTQFIKTQRKEHNRSILFALYCSSGETAKNIFREYREIDYIMYTESMIFAVLHIALQKKVLHLE